MDLEKLKEWLQLTSQYQQESFLNYLFQNGNSPEGAGTEHNRMPNLSFYPDIFPRCDLYELENKFILEAELPGINHDDIEIEFDDGELVIQGEYRTLKPKLQYYLKERPNRKFKKNVTIPFPVNKEGMNLSMENGILTIMIPKKEEVEIPIPIHGDSKKQP
jgi:HSP20 family protein